MSTLRTMTVAALGLMILGTLALAGDAAGSAAGVRAADREKRRETRVDRREENQAKRIEQGIKKGYLTTDEIAKLDEQQKKIAALESQFKSDGKLTRDEMKQMRTALDTASHCIWAEKHDTEGNQMPVYRLGKNIFAKDGLTAQLQIENLPVDQAKALMKDFRRTVELKRKLAKEDLSDADRAKFQAEYNDLLNKYFEIREPAATNSGK